MCSYLTAGLFIICLAFGSSVYSSCSLVKGVKKGVNKETRYLLRPDNFLWHESRRQTKYSTIGAVSDSGGAWEEKRTACHAYQIVALSSLGCWCCSFGLADRAHKAKMRKGERGTTFVWKVSRRLRGDFSSSFIWQPAIANVRSAGRQAGRRAAGLLARLHGRSLGCRAWRRRSVPVGLSKERFVPERCCRILLSLYTYTNFSLYAFLSSFSLFLNVGLCANDHVFQYQLKEARHGA